MRPVLTCKGAAGLVTAIGFSTTLTTESITIRRGPLPATGGLVGSESPIAVLAFDVELNLGPSEINTRRGPSPDKVERFEKAGAAVFLGFVAVSCGAPPFFPLLTAGEGGDEGAILTRVGGALTGRELMNEVLDVLLETFDVEFEVETVIEGPFTAVDSRRDRILDRFTIFKAGTGFRGFRDEYDELGVE